MGWGADNPPGGPLVAPAARRVDMLSGDVAPTKYFQALSEADNLVAELDTLRESQTRVQELEGAVRQYEGICDDWAQKYAELKAERDDLAERLDSLTNAHRITLAALAEARRGKTEPWHGQAVTS